MQHFITNTTKFGRAELPVKFLIFYAISMLVKHLPRGSHAFNQVRLTHSNWEKNHHRNKVELHPSFYVDDKFSSITEEVGAPTTTTTFQMHNKKSTAVQAIRSTFNPIIKTVSEAFSKFPILPMYGVDIQAKVSKCTEHCLFVANQERHGTMVYKNFNGKYYFEGFVAYDDSRTTPVLVKVPSILFDDPLPQAPGTILTFFAKIFMKKSHLDVVLQIRDTLMLPLSDFGDCCTSSKRAPDDNQIPRVGSNIRLSYKFVELCEFVVTPRHTLRPTRLITSHVNATTGWSYFVNWPIGGNAAKNGQPREDPLAIPAHPMMMNDIGENAFRTISIFATTNDHPNSGVVPPNSSGSTSIMLSERKLQRLLELTLSLANEASYMTIAQGLANTLNNLYEV